MKNIRASWFFVQNRFTTRVTFAVAATPSGHPVLAHQKETDRKSCGGGGGGGCTGRPVSQETRVRFPSETNLIYVFSELEAWTDASGRGANLANSHTGRFGSNQVCCCLGWRKILVSSIRSFLTEVMKAADFGVKAGRTAEVLCGCSSS